MDIDVETWLASGSRQPTWWRTGLTWFHSMISPLCYTAADPQRYAWWLPFNVYDTRTYDLQDFREYDDVTPPWMGRGSHTWKNTTFVRIQHEWLRDLSSGEFSPWNSIPTPEFQGMIIMMIALINCMNDWGAWPPVNLSPRNDYSETPEFQGMIIMII